MNYISVNGKIQPAADNALRADDRSYRYGDGVFETMKVEKGRLLLSTLHFARLYHSLSVLRIERPPHFTEERLSKEILHLCEKNDCTNYARVRLSISAGHGSLYDEGRKLQYLVEAWPLSLEMAHLNSNGLLVGLFPFAKKSTDQYASLKSSSFLSYSMAALFAKENKWNDALLLNTHDRIADSTIANIFMVKEGALYTPPISEGCVDGVMRKFLLSQLPVWGIACTETALDPETLQTADEVFLTNAIRGIRWVKQIGERSFGNTMATEIYRRLQTIWK